MSRHPLLLRVLAWTLAVSLLPSALVASLDNFVTRSSDRLYDGPQELRFISTNMPDVLQIITAKHFDSTTNLRLPDEYELRDAVLTVKQMGGQVMRTFCVTARNGAGPEHMFDVSANPVVPNEAALQVLDRLLQICHAEGIRVYIPLIAYSNVNRGDPSTYGDDFWIVGSATNLKFKDMVGQLLNRTNAFTGVRYKDDPAILGWESGNELVIGTDPDRRAWLHDFAAYVKGLDANHLFIDGRNKPDDVYNLYDEFFTDPNIDVVSYHTYVNLAAFNTPASTLAAIRQYTAGKKPLIVGEIAMYTTESALTALLAEQIADGTTGSNWWGHRFRNREGGFYRHSDTGSLFEDLNWPGFPASASYLPDIQKALSLQDILATHAYQIQGLARPPLPVPAAPLLLPIDDVGHISWEGSTGARAYDIQRAPAPAGPWSTVRADYPDHLVVADSLFCDEQAEGGATYYYRVVAKNDTGTSAPSNIAGPVSVGTTWLVDDYFDLSRTTSATNVQIDRAYNHYNYSDDLALLVRGNASAPGGVVYCLDGYVRSVAADLHQSTVDPSFAGSTDGVNFTPIASSALSYGTRKRFLATPPLGSAYRYLSINLNTPSTAEAVGRVAIEYSQPAGTTRAPSFSLPGGTYPAAVSVTLSTLTTGASIRYTTNGSTPTATSGTLYTGPIDLTASSLVKAVAFKAGLADSFISSAAYTIGLTPQFLLLEAEALPLVSLGAGTSVEIDGPASAGKWSKLNATGVGQYVEYTTPVIAAGTYALSYRYKTGGSRARHTFEFDGVPLGAEIDPYAATSFYLSTDRGIVTFPASVTHTIRLKTTGKNPASTGYLIGADAFSFTPLAAVAAPAFSLPAGTYAPPLTISLGTATAGASIRYTLDGSAPTAASGVLYSGPFQLSTSTTVKAIAFKSGMADSAVTDSPYTLVAPPPPVAISRGGYLLNRRTNQVTQVVTLTNTSALPVAGPLYLVLDGLSGNTSLVNATGVAEGAPYLAATTGPLAPGASVTVTLLFTYPASGAISYEPHVVTSP